MNSRAIAAQTLTPILLQKASLNTELSKGLSRVAERDRGLLQQLCYGTLRNLPRLQALANHMLKKPFKKQEQDLQALLMLGMYQLLEMRIPAHASIGETVEACVQLNKPWAKGLLNGVLRRLQREQDSIFATLENEPEFRFNHPAWMIDKLRHNWPLHWEFILEQNNQQPPMTLRINQQRCTRDQYLDWLDEAGIDAFPGAHSMQAIQLDEACDVDLLPGFDEGFASVQDEAAQLSADLLDLQPGQRVLDTCAAPGGKLCHIAEQEPDLSAAVAVELEAKRASRIEENLQRLQLDADVIVADAASQDWWDGQLFDRILIDAPCSASGVIRRHPDIKGLRRNEDLKPLADIQLAILTNGWQMLQPGGKLVYATCSVFPQENERVVERFLKQQEDAVHHDIEASWGQARPFGRQLFPQPDGHDGFYYALLSKAESPDNGGE